MTATPWRLVGDETGTCFEIFAYVPIELLAIETRQPMTGEEHRAAVELPDGFEYREAEMGNCVEHYATLGDKVISNQNCYAQFAAIDWSHA